MLRVLLCLSIAFTTCVSTSAQESRPQWANPERWEFLGSLTFDVPRLRDALAVDIDVLLASRLSRDPDELAGVLAGRLAEGYRHGGFPDVSITSEIVPERERLVFTVKEGPRYQNGPVRIEGATTIPVQELSDGLTKGTGPEEAFLRWSQPPEQGGAKEWYKLNGEKVNPDKPVWKPGKPTPFHAQAERGIVDVVKRILSRCGYTKPAFTMRLEPHNGGETTLVVSIADEGPRSVLGEIAVHGNTVNTAEQILTYLKVEAGQTLDIDSASRWQWRLQESARFYEAKVEITPPPLGAGPSRLDIHVVEMPKLPSLVEPLTPLQETAVRAARWMTAPKKEDWQLTLKASIPAEYRPYLFPAWRDAESILIRFTVSAADGAALLEAEFIDADQSPLWAAHAHFNRDQLQLLNLTRKAKLSFPVSDTKLILNANWLVRKPDAEGRASAMFFGFGFNNNGHHGSRAPEINTVVSPAAVLVEALKPEIQSTLEDGLLRLTRPGTCMEFDAETGRLQQLVVTDGDHLDVSISAESGLYRKRIQEQSAAYAGCREALNDAAWMTSTCNFLLDEATALGMPTAETQKHLAVLRRLLDAGVFRVIDEHLRHQDDPMARDVSDFEIPPPIPHGPPHPLAWLKPFLHVALNGYTAVFPRDTGAWIAGREAALALLGGKQGAISPNRVVDALDEADAGPISFLLAAEMFHYVSPYHRYVLSNEAAERLDGPAVRSDLRVLTDERSLAGKVVVALAEAVREASPEDLALLTSWVTKSRFDDVLQPAFREMSRRKDEPLSQVLPEVLEQLYPVLISPALVAELQRLEAPVRAAAANPDIKPLALPETPFDAPPKKKGAEPPSDLTKQQFLPKRD